MHNNHPSIRARYTKLTLLLGLVIIAYVFYTYFQFSNQHQVISTNLEEINNNLDANLTARSEVDSLYRKLELFLFDTQKEANYSQLTNNYQRSRIILEQQYFIYKSDLSEKVRALFSQLEKPVTELQRIGRDANLKYPGLALSANSMAVHQDIMKSSFEILETEITSGDFKPRNKKLLEYLLRTRILMEKSISQSRIYLANRVALFSSDILDNQAKSLLEINKAYLKQINFLKNLYRNEPDSFEGADNIQKIHDAQVNWYADFLELRKSSTNDHWRMDSYIAATELIPLFNEVDKTFEQQHEELMTKKSTIFQKFINKSDQLFYILVIMIVIFLLYIAVILMSLNWIIFRPLADIASVMTQKASGKEDAAFSPSIALETEQLVSSFKYLETQVKARTSDLEQAMNDAKHAEASARKANMAKSAFLSNMSHELRTPLHGIMSFAELGSARADKLDAEKTKTYFETILKSGHRLLDLITDLLDLEKLETGRVEINVQEHNIVNTVREVIEDLQSPLKEKQLLVEFHIETDKVNAVYDESKILQVVSNLVTNSITYTDPGKRIDIFFNEAIVDQKNSLKVTIKDQGIGIPENELEEIFHAFEQSSVTNTGAGGTGLGLAICQKLIDAHGGVIKAEKVDPPGAEFWFSIPYSTDPAGE